MKRRWVRRRHGLAFGCAAPTEKKLRFFSGVAAVASLCSACHQPLTRGELDGAPYDASASFDAGPSLRDAPAEPQLDVEVEAGAAVAADGPPAEPSLTWLQSEVELEPDGRSAALTFEIGAWERPVFALRTYAADAAASSALCFQLESVRADAEPWVPEANTADYGDYCTRCAQRVVVGSGYGLFILPSAAAPSAGFRTIELRIALRDCLTLTPLAVTAARPSVLVVESASFSAPAREARLVLPVVIVEATPHTFSPSGAQLERVFARMREIWSAAGIELALRGPFPLPRPAAPVVYSATDRAALSALARDAKLSARQANVEPAAPWIVLSPCLVREDPLRQGLTQPLATTPHVPGGFGVYEEPDGIFVAGERCGGLTPGPSYLESETLAATLAHELGHYLGLFHVREADGREDTLADTAADAPNLMQTQPSASATTLTESQISIARRHLALAVAKRQ